MNHSVLRTVLLISLISPFVVNVLAQSPGAASETEGSMKIEGWSLQSSVHVSATGEALSTPGYRLEGWHTAVVPGTVIGSLVADKTIPDPYYGVNMRNLINKKLRTDLKLDQIPMDPDSQFAVPWWYRTAFSVPQSYKGKVVWLHFGGINYRADIWVNGHQLADAGKVVGTWRIYDFNVTDFVKPGAKNAIAVRVSAPTQTQDLAISYVDWNPGMPDRYMGIFREVSLSTTGPVAIRYPAVTTHLDLPDTTMAHLTVVAQLVNGTDQPQTGTLQGSIADIPFLQKVELQPKETRQVILNPGMFPQFNLHNPQLWWPAQMGEPKLNSMQVKFVVNEAVSDHAETRFGIREITSELDANHHLLLRINGKRLLIRGGGWTMDLMMQKSQERFEDEFKYVQDLGLNSIRLEGMFEPDNFFNLADEKGILVLAGISCAPWETWPKWRQEEVDIAEKSVRAQILRLRSHPSLLVWFNGSDNPPPPAIERMYLAIEREYLWPNPLVSSVDLQPSSVTGESGVKESGPYEYVVPELWTEEKDEESDRGGAFGFNAETGPGPSIPPIETLQHYLPKEHLWPIDDWWTFHAGLGDFKDLHVFIHCLNKRYGDAADLDDFLMKSQMMRYEAIRAMYEGYTRNKYTSTGVVIWMLNNGWPSFIWNLYDYDLRAAGGYFGAKKSLETLHPMYGYDDRSVWVTSSQYSDAKKLTVTAKIYDLDMKERFSKQATMDIAADSTNKVFPLPEISDLTPVYFLKLTLTDADGKVVGSNLYWLTSKPETVTHGVINIEEGFAQDFADFRPLKELKKVKLNTAVKTVEKQGSAVTHITLRNEDSTLAFFVRLNLSTCSGGKEILPVLWSDNYISLLPGESREVTGTYRAAQPESVRVDVAGWNVEHASAGCAN